MSEICYNNNRIVFRRGLRSHATSPLHVARFKKGLPTGQALRCKQRDRQHGRYYGVQPPEYAQLSSSIQKLCSPWYPDKPDPESNEICVDASSATIVIT